MQVGDSWKPCLFGRFVRKSTAEYPGEPLDTGVPTAAADCRIRNASALACKTTRPCKASPAPHSSASSSFSIEVHQCFPTKSSFWTRPGVFSRLKLGTSSGRRSSSLGNLALCRRFAQYGQEEGGHSYACRTSQPSKPSKGSCRGEACKHLVADGSETARICADVSTSNTEVWCLLSK